VFQKLSSSRVFGVALFALGVLLATAAGAQGFPSKPMQIIVPVGAGGINDIISRLIGAKLSERLGQPVVILNRPGAGGIIGTELAAKAAPDGHTMVMVYSSHPVNPSLYAKLPYDSVRDFEPVTMVNTVNLVLVVNNAVPAKSLAELIALARAQPGKLNYGAVGTGSLGHLAAMMMVRMANVDIVHLPYKSAPEVTTALISGDAKLFFDSPITALPHIKSGRTRPLAVTSATRSSALPDVPTMAEAGIPGYEVLGWNGLLAPAGTPKPIVAKLNAEIVAILRSPDVTSTLKSQGVDVVAGTPEHFAAAISADIAKWAQIIKEAGIKLN
jgi:tripartite-type tricarboxylate transporter receptor subunit TctC